MNALDTNVLTRFLTADDAAQNRRATKLLADAEIAGEVLFVPDVVLLELIWVLRSRYAFSRSVILVACEQLSLMPVLRFESPDLLREWIRVGQSSSHDLADLLIGLVARCHGCKKTFTFDQRIAGSELFRLL